MTRPDVESILKLCESAPFGPGAASRKTMEGLCRHILHVEEEVKRLSTQCHSLEEGLRGAEADLAAVIDMRDAARAESARSLSKAEALDEALSKVEKLEEELKKYRLALEGLTPGGSEFHKDPERCVAYVRDRFDSGHQAKKDCVRLRRALAFKDE